MLGRAGTQSSAASVLRHVEMTRRLLVECGLGGADADISLDDVPWQMVTPEIAARFRALLASRYDKPSTRNALIASLRRLLSDAVAGQIMPVDFHRGVVSQLEPFVVGRGKPGQSITDAQLAALLAAACHKRSDLQARNVAIIHLLHCTGLRSCELISLNLDDVDTAQRRGTVVLAKTGDPHYFWLSHKAADAISSWSGHRGDEPGPLFTSLGKNKKGQRLTEAGIRSLFADLSESAGLNPPIRSHDFRWTLIRPLFAAASMSSRSVDWSAIAASPQQRGMTTGRRRRIALPATRSSNRAGPNREHP